jgi:5-methylcytosine-specific restriction protein B
MAARHDPRHPQMGQILQYDNFRAWLADRDATKQAVNTRSHAVRTISNHMAELGCTANNLDAAYDADKFAQLRQAITELRQDATNGGTRFRVLMPESVNPTKRLSSWRAWLGQYGRFLEASRGTSTGWPELERLREVFLDRIPDFEDFSVSDGEYYNLERSYKDRLCQSVRDLAGSSPNDRSNGEEILRVLSSGMQGVPLSWRTPADLKKSPSALADRLYAVIGALARAKEPTDEAVELACKAMEALRNEGLTFLRRGEILAISITVIACVRQNDATWFKVTKIEALGNALLKRKLFPSANFTKTDFNEYVDFMRRIFDVMNDDWAWQPRDLFDVQGFAWVALDENWKNLEASEPIILFDVAGEAYAPVRQKRTGASEEAYRIKPPGASNSADDATEETDIVAVARALLIERRPVRIAPVEGGTANYLTYGPGRKLISYKLRVDIATALGLPPENRISTDEPAADNHPEKAMPEPTNLILYGPPGTGKTYATAAEAVRLCGRPVSADRAELKRQYDLLVEAGQIGFVTFHQNYAYEDFVEGLRPPVGDTESSGFKLTPRPGIFREISALAEQARKKGGGSSSFDLGKRQVFKMSLGRAGSEDHIFDAAIEGNYVALGYGGEIDWSAPRYDGEAGYNAIRDAWHEVDPGKAGNSGDISQLWRFRSSMKDGDLVVVPWGNSNFRAIGEITGPYRYDPSGTSDYFHTRPVRWLLVPDEPLPVDTIYDKPFTMRSCYLLANEHLKREGLSRLLATDTVDESAPPDQFVLIIDEINRANISKVFGELITLLEPDKRIGAENVVKVKLPYSGDTFGVPANLHIIGTMNTADRSIALLDTALRRRFEFRELMPDPTHLQETVDGIPLQKMLHVLNERIEYLFDREHQIGHAYFMNCASRAAVDKVMAQKVIPLLAEYFYEDWSKVALVLGDAEGQKHFIERTPLSPPSGLNSDGDAPERYRWSVLKAFAPDAYEQFR